VRVVQHPDPQAHFDGPVAALEQLPLVLTIEEAAEVLRISRTAAYEQARIWRETDGRMGLPVVVLGRSLRVPRFQLERMLACEVLESGPVTKSPAPIHLAP
jgi:hypothetical protein